MSHRTLAVNASIVMPTRDIPERLATIRDAGFDAVEFWWPFASASPDSWEIEAFADAIERSGLELVGLNLFAGDLRAGDRGVLSWPGREAELRSSADVALRLAGRLGVRRFNVLYGNRIAGIDPAEQDALAVQNLRDLLLDFAAIGSKLLLEPVSGAPAYPLLTAAAAVAVLDRVAGEDGESATGLLLDLYHLAVNGDDIPAAISAFGSRVAHVQIADTPGRGIPGSGELPLHSWLVALRSAGYDGRVALEFAGTGDEPLTGFRHEEWEDVA